ncbi:MULTISPECIES: hypothetical protein [Achromobacter]|uniref:Uncharacterized protein n=1 Tax=Achromobacter aegrifaciens TaxID=1287736 RepID=A0AAD2J1K1_ACHAE|nr:MULTISPECIES: hypothetical protein [Achromobacter]PTN50257.1 hypothetical protein DAI43_18130 [Achromobacter xylosoxidans]MBD9380946.1 hypothetical protein [Achromobacter sp. ACM02]MBD9419319.1 hypothetical protein [Achromobacter sp. ACM04]MBD9475955.1 hypothetical protein [Achromobacter sp. ACM01]MDQ1762606.1 hypothetical protein [Achromobacter aegrifaciens]
MHELLADWCEILNRLLRDVADAHATAQARDSALRHAHRHSCQAPICFRMSGTTVSHLAETLDCAIRASCARHDNSAWVQALDVAYTKFLLYLIRDVDRWSSGGLHQEAA